MKKKLEALQKKYDRLDTEMNGLAAKYNAKKEEQFQILSQMFKVETGTGYGEIFEFDGKKYEIITEFFVVREGKTNKLRVSRLRLFLQGKTDSPFDALKGKGRKARTSSMYEVIMRNKK